MDIKYVCCGLISSFRACLHCVENNNLSISNKNLSLQLLVSVCLLKPLFSKNLSVRLDLSKPHL